MLHNTIGVARGGPKGPCPPQSWKLACGLQNFCNIVVRVPVDFAINRVSKFVPDYSNSVKQGHSNSALSKHHETRKIRFSFVPMNTRRANGVVMVISSFVSTISRWLVHTAIRVARGAQGVMSPPTNFDA